MEASIGGKWLELLTEIAPGVKRATVMFNPDTAPYARTYYLPSFEAAARSFKVAPIVAPVHSEAEIETAIISLGREPGGSLVVLPDTFSQVHRAAIILLAARNKVPAAYYDNSFAVDGGLFSYGPDQVDVFRRAAPYVDRILKGEKRRPLRPRGGRAQRLRSRHHGVPRRVAFRPSRRSQSMRGANEGNLVRH
jgi:putative ABC transport system substrate-binding protein